VKSFLSIRGVLLVTIAILCLPVKALALEGGESLRDESPVRIEADQLTFDENTSTYHASGQVRVRKGDLTLLSDRVDWNTETGEAEASGHVRLSEPAGELESEEMSLNLDTGRGRLTDGRVFLREHNFHLTGAEIEKLGEQTYRVEDGAFTTCDGPNPSWRFSARRLDVTLGGYARARDVVFYLHKLPVLYTPYLLYPVKSERESGFLMPRYGYSQKRGTELSLAYYQVIDRNMDATFYLDYLSDLGIGKGIEYRYVLGQDNEGELKGYHINGLADGDDRYAFNWLHGGTLPGDVWLSADAEYVSSRDYFDDFGEAAEEYNKDTAQSVVAGSRSWGNRNLGAQLKYIKDLEQKNDLTLQRLPEVRFESIRQRLGETPVYAALESGYTYFWRKEGVKGQRLTARPSLSAIFKPVRALAIQPEIGFRERLYWTSDEGPGFEKEGLWDFSTHFSSRLDRVYSPGGPVVKKIRHSIEPELVYSYISPENQEHLPQFDALDEIGPENKIALALTNRFVARLEPEEGETVYHEFLYLRLSQEYDIRESRRDRLNSQDRLRPFSDIRAEMILRPTRWSYLDIDARYDVNADEDGFTNRFVVFNARGAVTDRSGNELSLDYRYRQEELEYLSGEVDLSILKPVYLGYRHRYDFEEQTTLEQAVDLEYRAQCWSLYLTYRDRLEDTEYLVSFALTGLGRVAEFGGSLDEAED